MERRFECMGVGRVEVGVVGGQCGGRPCGRGGFSEVGQVVGMVVGKVVEEREPIGGHAGAQHWRCGKVEDRGVVGVGEEEASDDDVLLCGCGELSEGGLEESMVVGMVEGELVPMRGCECAVH